MIRSFGVLCFTLFSFGVHSQKLENSLLWKISGNGIKKPSYLYGTVHATCDTSLEPNVHEAMKKTSQLYLEIDMDDPKMDKSMMNLMKMKNGITMSSLVSKEDFEILDAFLIANTGFSAKLLNSVKPALIGSMLTDSLLKCKSKSIEEELMRISKSEKEEIYGLEGINEQAKIFDLIPYEEQMNDLMLTVKGGILKFKEEFEELMKLYNEKDIESLLTMGQSNENILSRNEDLFLKKRNQNWIPVISEVAKYKPTFFGVGAAHLAGENGVIRLLRKEGFTVEAVK